MQEWRDSLAGRQRTLAEAEACLAALPCYMDSEQALAGLLENAARAEGMSVDPDALDWIVDRIGGDRGQTRSEIDKLILYKQSDENRTITQQDALAVLGDTSALGIDDVIGATFDGDRIGLDRALDRVFAEGGHPVQLVRAVQRYAEQLNLVSAHARGGNLEGAMFKARGLPRGGPLRQRFERHLRSWPLPRLNDVLKRIVEAELDCKTTGLPDEAIVVAHVSNLKSLKRPLDIVASARAALAIFLVIYILRLPEARALGVFDRPQRDPQGARAASDHGCQ